MSADLGVTKSHSRPHVSNHIIIRTSTHFKNIVALINNYIRTRTYQPELRATRDEHRNSSVLSHLLHALQR
jgi:hypothetical protein